MAKSNQNFVDFLFARLPVNNLLQGEYYTSLNISEFGTVPAQYLMGTIGQKCTQSRLDYAYKKYYSTMSKAEFDRITKDWVNRGVYLYDCQGLLDYFVDDDVNARYNYYYWCSKTGQEAKDFIYSQGSMAAGACVFKENSVGRIHHVGYIAGRTADGVPLVIEAKNIRAGIVMSKITDGWNRYGVPDKVLNFTGRGTIFRVNKPMDRGEKYLKMQEALSINGYDAGGSDGIWGPKSQRAFNAMIINNGGKNE